MPRLDYGPCNFDIRHNLRLNGIYQLPFNANRLVAGWQLSAILSAASGRPFSVTDGFDQAGDQNSTPRPNVIPGCQVMVQTRLEWYNPNCFALQPAGEYGNLGRNTFTSPGLFDLDFAVLKDTKITERFSAQFRAEFFNILNHTNFAAPNVNNFVDGVGPGGVQAATISGTAGQINATIGTSRQIQFALKLLF